MEIWYQLVSLLPFEWAEPDSMFFMKHALLAVLVISPLFGILSTMVVHSRMSFFPMRWVILPLQVWQLVPFVGIRSQHGQP